MHQKSWTTPKLSYAEVLTIEVVGEFLGMDTDKDIYLFFRRHYASWFTILGELHRTTSPGKQPISGRSRSALARVPLAAPHEPTIALVDSMPLPARLFARAYRSLPPLPRGGRFGKDKLLKKQTFYGFRARMRICWPGLITHFSVAPVIAHELPVVPELLEFTGGLAIGRHQVS